jgi:hypothetical protein
MIAINASTCTAAQVESSSWSKRKKTDSGPTIKQCKKEEKKSSEMIASTIVKKIIKIRDSTSKTDLPTIH